MASTNKHELVLFSGYAKLPEGITATELYKVIGLVVVIDVNTGVIKEADCTLATQLASRQVSGVLIGHNISNGIEDLQRDMDNKYQGSAKKAISTAIRIIFDKYRSFKLEEEQE